MKGMPHYRQYPMGDVVNANLEPGEYVVRRNAVNSIGTENMEMLNHADGAHGALNKLMVSASLVNLQPQDNSPVKIEANGFPIADSPVRQRVDATRNMQKGGEVDFKQHMMYDKNDKGYLAKTYEDHLRMKEMGYSHKGMQEGGEVEESSEPVLQKGLGNRLKRFLAERQLKKFGEQDPQFKAWYGQDMSPGSEKRDINVRGEIYDVQEALGNKVLQDQSSYLGRETYGEEGSPYQGASFVDVQEGGPKKGREAQYLETDKGRYSLGETHYGGLLDPVRNLFSEIPRKVDSGEDFSYQDGGEVGKYEKALQKAEMMGDAGYALPESLSAPAEEMSNMRPAEDLYGMYMRMGPQMVKDKMSGMESRALDSLLQQKMNNMDRPAVPQYGMGGMIDEYNMGGYVKKYQDGGEVLDLNSNNLKSSGVLEMLRLANAGTGVKPERLEQLNPERQIKKRESIFNRPDSNEYNMPTFQGDSGAFKTPVMRAPSDSYGGNEIKKNLNVIIPYLQSQGKMKTPMQEKIEFLYNRLNVDPNNPPSSLQGLKGSALLQRLGNEGI